MSIAPFLLVSDLDGTLIPTADDESPEARPLLRALVGECPSMKLVYSTGRSYELARRGIEEFDLPEPHAIVVDVGTRLVERDANGEWRDVEAWTESFLDGWRASAPADIRRALTAEPDVRPQEDEHQSRYKVSFYASPSIEDPERTRHVRDAVDALGLDARVTVSVDDVRQIGLIDVTPRRANKRDAASFVIDRYDMPVERTVFAGDSGNDATVFSCEIPSVAVRNTSDAVFDAAVESARAEGNAERLMRARGEFLGLNGRYAAGVLEGLAHFLPEVGGVLERLRRS